MNIEIPEMMTIREASYRVGLPYSTIRRLCLEQRISHIKIGKKFMVNFTDLCRYLNESGLEKTDEIIETNEIQEVFE